jgi:hypothetical protein
MGNCCYYTNPRKYFYYLNNVQKSIIKFHCPLFMDIKYLVKQPVSFTLNGNDYLVKQGFICDGVSSGCAISNLICCDTAIMHDFLYATHPEPMDDCDEVLKPFYRCYITDLFGEEAWESSGRRGALVVSQNSEIVTFSIYHSADYTIIDQTINLSLDESKEFASFFETVSIHDK